MMESEEVSSIADQEAGAFERVMLKKREEDCSFRYQMIFTANGKAIAFADEDGRDGVYELALPSFTLGKKLFGSARYDVDAMIVNDRGDDMAGIAITEKRRRIEWLDPEFKGIQQDLDKTVGPGNARILELEPRQNQAAGSGR